MDGRIIGPPEGRYSMNSMMLPVGIENFEELRTRGYYYVDKTMLITDLLKTGAKVTLFTRPRRFGKTLNMSMLKCFFEIGGDKSIFDGLAISEHKDLCNDYMGKFPVVFISLKTVDGTTFEEAYDMLFSVIQKEALRLRYLLDSDKLTEDDLQPLKKIISGEKDSVLVKNSLQMFCSLLQKHYGQKAILLIDEYDVPLDKANLHNYYEQMLDIIRAMFNVALKTNDSLYFAALTGCLRVSHESIFTGTNNFSINSISDVQYDECFGFTETEVCQMMTDYGVEQHLPEAREWYDGYLFGEQNIYCPWDVINYCNALREDSKAEPQAYWMNTSGNDMVCNLIAKSADGTTQMEIERLIAGETINKALNEQLTHEDIKDSIDNLWTLLYLTGYLTISKRPVGGEYLLRIPNKEVHQIYTQQVLSWFKAQTLTQKNALTDLYAAFESGNTEAISEYLNEQLIDTVSFYDAHESFYHGFLLALLNTCSNWQVSSNRETGKGRSDIIVQRKDRKFGCVIEVKNVKEWEQLDDACNAAMKQIEEKDYIAVLRSYRVKTIWTYGIAFWDKECRIIAKQVSAES